MEVIFGGIGGSISALRPSKVLGIVTGDEKCAGAGGNAV
jgi:hypothetical protein